MCPYLLAAILLLSGAAPSAGLPGTPSASQTPPALSRAAQARGATTETKHLIVAASASAASVAQGGRVTLYADVTPKPGMHVYSPEQKDVIPVAVQIEADAAVRPGATKYPKPEKYFFAPLEETQLVFSRPFRLAREVTVTAPVSGTVTIRGSLRYQACDDAVCYMPQTVPMSWTVAVR